MAYGSAWEIIWERYKVIVKEYRIKKNKSICNVVLENSSMIVDNKCNII
jgi:hypothetical protein